jgi:hypothetical protein
MPARKTSEADFATLFHALGADWKKFEDRRYCPICHNLIFRVDNQPFDGLGVIYGRAFAVEIKAAELAFRFADIEPHQRAGLIEWQHRHIAHAWLGLQMGTAPANARSGTPRRLWLIDWDWWMQFEAGIQQMGRLSLPYSTQTTNRIDMRTAGIGAVDSLGTWALEHIKGGWKMPETHPFYQKYIQPNKELYDNANNQRLAS